MAFSFLTELLARVPALGRLRSPLSAMGQPVLLTSLGVAGLILGLRAIGVFERSELALYDQFTLLQPDRPPDDRLLVVGINEVDLQTIKEWPLSDATLAQLLTSLQVHQPRVIGVDLLRDIPSGTGREQLLTQLQKPNVLTVCKVNTAADPGVPPPPELRTESVVSADLVLDRSGILRRNLLFLNPPSESALIISPHLCNDPKNTLMTLGFGTAVNYLAAEEISASVDDEKQLMMGTIPIPAIEPRFGGYSRQDTAGYQIMLRYRSEKNAVPVVSLLDVVEGRVDDRLIRDRIVLIGYTTPLAKDDFFTPYSSGPNDQQKMPGVIVHAQAASQILDIVLNGRSLMTVWPLPIEIFWIYGWVLAIGIFAWYVRHPIVFGIGVMLAAGVVYGVSLVLFIHGVWIPLVPVLVGIVMTSGGVVLLDRFNNSDYGKRVVRQVKTFLNIDIDQAKLDKQVSEITDTDYFQDLKKTVQTLRTQPRESPPTPNINVNAPSTSKVKVILQKNSIKINPSALNSEDLQTLSEPDSTHYRPEKDHQSQASIEETPDANTSDQIDGLDYLLDLNAEARRLKNFSDQDD